MRIRENRAVKHLRDIGKTVKCPLLIMNNCTSMSSTLKPAPTIIPKFTVSSYFHVCFVCVHLASVGWGAQLFITVVCVVFMLGFVLENSWVSMSSIFSLSVCPEAASHWAGRINQGPEYVRSAESWLGWEWMQGWGCGERRPLQRILMKQLSFSDMLYVNFVCVS